jgi:uncharacterized protein (TIGR03435 family)
MVSGMKLKPIGVALTITIASALAQTNPTAKAEFEVASIKRARSEESYGYRFGPGGRAVLTRLRLRDLILVAWHIQDFRILGDADWIDAESYDVEAKAEGSPTEDEFRLMLRSLLADRFQLAIRRETRELPIYRLVPAKSGARLGTGMIATKEGSCTPIDQYSGPQPPPETLKPPMCGFRQRLRPQNQGRPLMQLKATGVTSVWFARALGTMLDREVTDGTGLDGSYDFTLDYAPDDHLLKRVIPDAQPDDTAPALFTALQEQLGLKLEPHKGPVEVFVIDHAERPSEN